MALGTDADGDGLGRRRVGQPREQRKWARRRTDNKSSGGAGVLQDAALATLDKFNRGVVLLGADGLVCFANPAVEAMVARKDGLRLRRKRLQFDDVDANAALQEFLVQGDRAVDGGSVVLRVENRRRDGTYRVLVSPLLLRRPRDSGHVGYCVFIYEPNGGQKPLPGPVLKNLYHLTAAEARLANELFLGQSLAAAARACGTSVNTAKSVLKRIFTKCAVHSQSELVLLLSLGPRTL